MKTYSKATFLSLSLAVFISSCATELDVSSTIPQNKPAQIDRSDFQAFASESANLISIEHDADKDSLITQTEAAVSSSEMNQMDVDGDGNISKTEISSNLFNEFENSLKVTEALANSAPDATYAPKYNGTLPQKTPSSVFKNNKVQLFIDREEILPMMLETIKSARVSIQMDVFLLGGTIGTQIAHELVKKKNEGVNVEVTMDPNLGFAGPTQSEIYQVVNILKANNIDFKLYPLHLMPIVSDGPLKNKFQIDHNKLFVIDGSTFITGGFNLFDIGVINRDLMLKIEGPTALEASDLMHFEWSLGDKYVAPKPPKDVFVIKQVDQPGDSMVKITKTDPYESTTKPALIEMIDNAKQTVFLSVLEFSDLDVTRALIRAYKRGVDVRVIMDRKDTNDKYAGGVPVPTYFPNILPARELVKNRVPVKWYDSRSKGQELHMKVVVADSQKMIAGSTNFTRQAFTTFRETSVYIDGGTAPQKMTRTFMEDWLNSSTAIKKLTLKDKIKAKVVEYLDKKYYAWW